MSFGDWMPVPDVPLIEGQICSDCGEAVFTCIGCGCTMTVEVPDHMNDKPFPWELIGSSLGCGNCDTAHRIRVVGIADPDEQHLDERAVLERIFQERGQ